jgi:alcohol dehydrogenase
VPPEVRASVWRRLAGDMKPPLLAQMARTIPFAELPKVFDDYIHAKVVGRIVVDLSD